MFSKIIQSNTLIMLVLVKEAAKTNKGTKKAFVLKLLHGNVNNYFKKQ